MCQEEKQRAYKVVSIDICPLNACPGVPWQDGTVDDHRLVCYSDRTSGTALSIHLT